MTFPPRAMSVIAREAGAVLALTSANRQRLSRDPPEARILHLDRLGRSLPHLLSIVTGLRARAVASRSLTEQMDATTPHGELLFSIFGALHSMSGR